MGGGSLKPSLTRFFSHGSPLQQQPPNSADVDMKHVHHAKARQKDFFKWMDKELAKVETFYQEREEEAGLRLKVLRDQLHEMRNRRTREVAAAHSVKQHREVERSALNLLKFGTGDSKNGHQGKNEPVNGWLGPFERALDEAKIRKMGAGPNTKALQNMAHTPEMHSTNAANPQRPGDPGRDYTRRPHEQEVTYRSAKRKLKLALQEYYRGLELLKSYALLNRTAFRKINKKYDKAVNAHPPLRFMNEKVNKAYFVQSEVVEGYMHAVEDLYARYFERGNHKVAVGKLRSTIGGRPGDFSRSVFQNGLFMGIGAVFAIQGIIYGTDVVRHDPDPTIQTNAGYLLQIYGGYFLMLYLFFWFVLDCRVWTHHKINYQFVFEFDPRHNLDWRELAEFPSFLMLMFGLFLWLNFSGYGSPEMFIYYPVVLIFITAVLIFLPLPVLFYRSRRWFIYAHVSHPDLRALMAPY